MKKVVWIDVGTHFGQEYSSVFGSSVGFFYKIFKRFIGSFFLGRGQKFRLEDVESVIRYRRSIKAKQNCFSFYFVEANSKIIAKKSIYGKSNGVFNLAITDKKDDSINIVKLFLGDNNELSQGSSIFEAKHNVSKNSYMPTLGVPAPVFFKALSDTLNQELEDEYVVMLRLNCEGVEDAVIYSAHEFFGHQLSLISGSLKDVAGCKGQADYEALMQYIESSKIPFVFFSSNVDSWPAAFEAVDCLLNED